MNKWILEGIEQAEDETIKLDGVVCTRFLCVGQIVDCSIFNN